jgi:nicotinamidase-related amidase
MKKKSALLIIDVQTGLFEGYEIPYNEKELIKTINELISKARASNTPIIFIQHNGDGEDSPLHPNRDGWKIHPELINTTEDIYIQKNHPDSFQDTQLQNQLDSLGVEKIIVAGLQTEYCIDTTCRRAYSMGYEVILIEDGHSTYDTEYLTAEQVINHHNQVLGGWFVMMRNSAEDLFMQ